MQWEVLRKLPLSEEQVEVKFLVEEEESNLLQLEIFEPLELLRPRV